MAPTRCSRVAMSIALAFLFFLPGTASALLMQAPWPVSASMKPRAAETRHTSWCSGRSCRRFCVPKTRENRGKTECEKRGTGVVNREELAKHDAAGPSDLVGAADAVRAAMKSHPTRPCDPDALPPARGEKDPLARCGIYFGKGDGVIKIRAAVVPGLVRAAQLAREYKDSKGRPAGYSLYVGYGYRSHECQTQLACNHFAERILCDGNTLSCPGPNIHTDGVAVDIYLARDGKQLTYAGAAVSCRVAAARVRSNTRLRALHDIMFKAGWWNYCKETWHFEYTQNPYGGVKNNRVNKLP